LGKAIKWDQQGQQFRAIFACELEPGAARYPHRGGAAIISQKISANAR
jgi:hypothetical protein